MQTYVSLLEKRSKKIRNLQRSPLWNTWDDHLPLNVGTSPEQLSRGDLVQTSYPLGDKLIGRLIGIDADDGIVKVTISTMGMLVGDIKIISLHCLQPITE